MDTNRTSRTGRAVLLIALWTLSVAAVNSTAVNAQTIYKQVDEEGRVLFTDQPKPTARTVASFQTGAAASATPSRAETRAEQDNDTPVREAAEPPRRYGAEFAQASTRFPLTERAVESAARTPAQTEPGSSAARQSNTPTTSPGASTIGSPMAPSMSSPSAYIGSTSSAMSLAKPRTGEAERAVSTYTPLASPQSAQVDAIESARRARQDAAKEKNAAAKVLLTQPLPPNRAPLPAHNGLGFFYALWVLTFFCLSAGLLYVAWHVLRLILGGAFPRWEVGTA
jgi:hypothetical protein